jgi:hypothetical protein
MRSIAECRPAPDRQLVRKMRMKGHAIVALDCFGGADGTPMHGDQ